MCFISLSHPFFPFYHLLILMVQHPHLLFSQMVLFLHLSCLLVGHYSHFLLEHQNVRTLLTLPLHV
uniref:Uncharacterized protein n=1 Tax=mine drainage metagenome TaxID=410659 RepID=E6QNL7_9ZZZZ